MSEKNRKIVLFCALGIAIWWGYSNYPWRKDKDFMTDRKQTHIDEQTTASSRQTGSATSSAPVPAEPPRATADIAGLEYVESKKWGVDPFFSPHSKAPLPRARQTARPAPSYSLRAVIFNETDPSAYINGKIVRTGETVDGATIKKITRNSVVLNTTDGERQIYVRR